MKKSNQDSFFKKNDHISANEMSMLQIVKYYIYAVKNYFFFYLITTKSWTLPGHNSRSAPLGASDSVSYCLLSIKYYSSYKLLGSLIVYYFGQERREKKLSKLPSLCSGYGRKQELKQNLVKLKGKGENRRAVSPTAWKMEWKNRAKMSILGLKDMNDKWWERYIASHSTLSQHKRELRMACHCLPLNPDVLQPFLIGICPCGISTVWLYNF